MKKLPLHGKNAQARIYSDGTVMTEEEIVEMEYNKKNKGNQFKKIDALLKNKKKKDEY